MLEYIVLNIEDWGAGYVSDHLNAYAKQGWRVTCMNNKMIVLEREISPRIEETKTETERILTYAFPL